MAEDWYRSPDWNKRVEADFERLLSRASAWNRPQYLRIKALVLLDAGGRTRRFAARDLLQRVLDEYPDSLDVVIAHEALGELCDSEGDPDGAEAHYRAALHLSLEGHVHGDANLRLPELLIRSGQTAKLADAEAILGTIDVERDLAFASQRFRYAVCHARLATARDNPDEASDYATEALRLAALSSPDFPRHPTVGRVAADESLLGEMQRLAGDSDE